MVLFAKNLATKAYLLSHRTFSASKPANFNYLIKSLPNPSKKIPHPEHVKSINLWRNLFIFAGIPVIALVNINIELFEEHHPKRPDFKPYEYMRKRTKTYPWRDGVKTLFHNDYYNALPEGYEHEDDYLEKLHGGEHH